MFVLDATALVSLIDGYDPVFSLWRRADVGEIVLGFPTSAIVEAARARGVSASGWGPILWPPSIEVLPLTELVAVEVGAWEGSLATRHALWESRALGWRILTRDPNQYWAGTDMVVV